MRRSITNLEELPDLTLGQSGGVDELMKLLGPPKEGSNDCRRDVRDALRMIGGMLPLMPTRLLRNHLTAVATKLTAVIAEINKLPRGVRASVYSDTFLKDLDHFRASSEGTAKALSGKKRSGGSHERHVTAIIKRIAAGYAFDLLTKWTSRAPSLTKDGKYYTLTKALIEVATDCPFIGNVERACAYVLHNDG
jgi:hypothetical protein